MSTYHKLLYIESYSRYLASGSGDTTVRFWDVNTETPHFTCKGKQNCSSCVSRHIVTIKFYKYVVAIL